MIYMNCSICPSAGDELAAAHLDELGLHSDGLEQRGAEQRAPLVVPPPPLRPLGGRGEQVEQRVALGEERRERWLLQPEVARAG